MKTIFSHKVNLWLVIICLFFLFTRLYQITDIPKSLYWDEASIGYNAYSILKTGKDEWGVIFPLHFRAFGEFKLPVYVYSVMVFEALFGLSELAVRLPAVLYSLGSLLLIFALTKLISKRESTAIFAALFFATCPWFFIFSRTGYEVTAGLFFYLLGVWFFLYGNFYGKKYFYFLFSTFYFLISMYSYNSFRIITPLTILILVIFQIWENKDILKQNLKIFLICISILIIGILPIIRFSLSGGNTRFEQVSIFKSDQTILTFATNYLSHFNPQFLLLDGDTNLRSAVPGLGEINLVQFLLFLIGLFWVIKNRSKLGFLFLSLILIAPIPAAITNESPHSLRSLSITPFLAILSAIGAEKLMIRKWVTPTLIILILGFFGLYFYQFLTFYPNESANDWQYPYKIINTQYNFQISQSENVYISPKLSQPYIFTLFYQKIDPNIFHQQVEYNPPDLWGVSLVNSFGKYHYIDVQDLSQIPANTLIFSFKSDTINPGQLSIQSK